MTKLDDSTRRLLASITAQNALQSTTAQSAFESPEPVVADYPLPSSEAKGKMASTKPLSKNLNEKFEEPNITRLRAHSQ